MRVGNFSLLIPEGREKDSGHVELPHGQIYTLRLGNHDYQRRCDAEVTLDGKVIATFRLDTGRTFTIERSPDDHGRFTFFKAGSDEAQTVGEATIGKDNRGLIQVQFKPEKQSVQLPRAGSMRLCSTPRAAGGQSAGGQSAGGSTPDFYGCVEKICGDVQPQNLSAGVTGLTGHSNQSFTTVADLNYDLDKVVTISLRLVCSPKSILDPRPLKPAPVRANPIPAPVE